MEILEPQSDAVHAVLVVHSWWGLTDSFRRYGRGLAQAGYLVGLADLFAGQTASSETEARRLKTLPRRVPMYKELGKNIAELKHGTGCPGQTIGVVGFSMGGHWAVWLSQRPEYGISSAILYYAARGGEFSKCSAGIQAHYAEHDEWVSKSARASMEKAISKAGCAYQAFEYPGTTHWFAEADRKVEFDPASARLALDRDIAHLARSFRDGVSN